MEWRFRSVKWKDCGVTVRHKDKQDPTARDCEDVLYLRVGCRNHEPGHLPQPRRRSEMREVTKYKRGRDTREVLQCKTRPVFLVKLAESDA
jgi:hypothetical protein